MELKPFSVGRLDDSDIGDAIAVTQSSSLCYITLACYPMLYTISLTLQDTIQPMISLTRVYISCHYQRIFIECP